MIRRTVMWKLKEEALGNSKEENCILMKEKLESLAGRIDGVFTMSVDYNIESDGFDVFLISDVEDEAAIERYMNHPLHVEVAKFIKEVTSERAAAQTKV